MSWTHGPRMEAGSEGVSWTHGPRMEAGSEGGVGHMAHEWKQEAKG